MDFSDGGGSASEPCAPSAADQNNLSDPHTQVIAIYDCHADAEDELSFAKGDLLNLVRPPPPTPARLFNWHRRAYVVWSGMLASAE